MGYRGKLEERERARELRARSWTLKEIADALGVSRSSVSVWVRDVEFVPNPRQRPAHSGNALARRRLAEIAQLDRQGRERIGNLSDRDLLVAGAALYAAEGSKEDRHVKFANTHPQMILLFCTWLRRFFDVDETRLRGHLYLHAGLDLAAATSFWSGITGIPVQQFRKPYRATPRAGIRHTKHAFGCLTVAYSCSRTHRAIMGLVRALLDPAALQPGTSPGGETFEGGPGPR